MNKLKKMLAALLSVSMVFGMASCDKSEESSTSDKTEETTTSQTEAVTEVVEGTESAESVEEVTEEPEPSIDVSKLKYDFTGLDSEQYANILASGKYVITVIDNSMGAGYSIEQTNYLSGTSARQLSTMMGTTTDILVFDGVSYMVMDGYHCEYDLGVDLSDMRNFDTFSGIGYYESGEIEYNGAIHKYDSYYYEPMDVLYKFILDNENTLVAVDISGAILVVKECSGEFDESVLQLSENSQALTQEEFYTKMMEAAGYGETVEGEVTETVEGENPEEVVTENEETVETTFEETAE